MMKEDKQITIESTSAGPLKLYVALVHATYEIDFAAQKNKNYVCNVFSSLSWETVSK